MHGDQTRSRDSSWIWLVVSLISASALIGLLFVAPRFFYLALGGIVFVLAVGFFVDFLGSGGHRDRWVDWRETPVGPLEPGPENEAKTEAFSETADSESWPRSLTLARRYRTPIKKRFLFPFRRY